MKLEIKTPYMLYMFLNILVNLKKFKEDVTMYFNKDGLYIQEFDNAQICVLELNITKKWFGSGNYIVDENEVISINCSTLSLVLSCYDKKHTILILECENADNLNIIYDGDNANRKEFSIPCMDINKDLFEVPNVDFDIDITMNSNFYKKTVSELLKFSQDIEIKADGETLKFLSLGDIGKFEMDMLNTDDEESLEYAINEGIKYHGTFNLRYLDLTSNFIKLSNKIEIHTNDNAPMLLSYNLDYKTKIDEKKGIIKYSQDNDNEDYENYLKFYIAPKVNEYDD